VPRASSAGPYAAGPPAEAPATILARAARVSPSERQLAWQRLELTAFLHFGINTFTDREWGDGGESPALFNPTALDARQWMRALRAASVRLVILTAKHHDGFALWPSGFSSHSVAASPWRGGRGDVVREAAEAARTEGLRFGVYLSPWDRHEPSYGDSPRYNDFFRSQLRELLTSYGAIDEVWFDGAKGEGADQTYEWESYYRIIRELQPQAAIAIMGPDVRWVGTESGYGRETEWSVVPTVGEDPALAAAGLWRPDIDPMAPDLGSRARLAGARALFWYPAEVDVSIRPGWFYHQAEDARVKSVSTLLDIYFSSVGRNATLLLNVPPDRRGLIAAPDSASLAGLGSVLRATFATDLAEGARLSATHGDSAAVLTWLLPSEREFDVLMLQERIERGQRVESFEADIWDGDGWRLVTAGTTIGYKRLLRFPAVRTDRVRLRILASRAAPQLARMGLFRLAVPGN
jgi:alpha-L-fucosidase